MEFGIVLYRKTVKKYIFYKIQLSGSVFFLDKRCSGKYIEDVCFLIQQ